MGSVIQEATFAQRVEYRAAHPERFDLRLGNATCTDSDRRICEAAFKDSDLGVGAMTVMNCGIWTERLEEDYPQLAEGVVCGAIAKQIHEGAVARAGAQNA